MRKYNKGEYVNAKTIGPNTSNFQGIGTIEKWKYYPENKTYDYFLRDLTGDVHGWWEEGHLENLKIYLPREDDEKMKIFYETLNTSNIGVTYQHNPKKETYVLVGKDLHIAKAFFNAILRNKWTNEVIVDTTLYQFYPNGTLRNTIEGGL